MATFTRIEEIEAWQKTRNLVRRIYEVSNQGGFSKDFALRDQIRRAGISILSNIAEGFERSGSAEFAQFLSIAKGSAGEVKSQLYIAFVQGYISKEEFGGLLADIESTGRMVCSLMSYLRRTKIRGSKYKS